MVYERDGKKFPACLTYLALRGFSLLQKGDSVGMFGLPYLNVCVCRIINMRVETRFLMNNFHNYIIYIIIIDKFVISFFIKSRNFRILNPVLQTFCWESDYVIGEKRIVYLQGDLGLQERERENIV